MKIDPLKIVFNKEVTLNKKIYFISGNEITLMEKILSLIVRKYHKEMGFEIIKIDTIDNFISTDSLFQNKKLFVGRGCKGINKENIDRIQKQENTFVFMEENSQKNKLIKNYFEKDKNSYLINCYELDKDVKITVVNGLLKNHNIDIPQDIYWPLVDKLDNRYALLENSMDKITKLSQKDIKIENINKLLTIDSAGKDKVFFLLLKNYSEIVNVYRDKIVSTSDVNEFYYYCKYYCELIINSNDVKEYSNKLPRYLFREKNFLIEIFRKYNKKKKKLLLNLLSKTERALRKESEFSIITGLRFILSIKKITIS